MDLFVINRHDEAEEFETKPQGNQNEEKEKLDKLLKKIEKKKKLRKKQKEKVAKTVLAIQRTTESREYKRKIKKSLISIPQNSLENFVDSNTRDLGESSNNIKEETKEVKHVDKKHKFDPEVEGFTILGVDKFASKSKVKRVLPNWLCNPSVISVNLQHLDTKVSDLKDLDKGIRKLLKSNGIKFLFPVQAEVIPWLLKSIKHADIILPRDACVSAPTGSGKTLAFVLPVIHALKRHKVKKIRALVILPTQDLAQQVYKAFKLYSQNTNIDISLITGSHPFATEQTQLIQENKAFGLISKVDILICTAGRLVDHLKFTKGFNLKSLEFLIIDEADRVLENIQNDWLYHLEKHIYQDDISENGKILNLNILQKRRAPQKLLFSATLSQDPEKLQKLSLFQPKLFTSIVENSEQNVDQLQTERFIGKYTTPKELTEKYIVTTLDLKPLCLYKFIKTEKLTKTIVFTHSGTSTHRLAILLQSLFKNELKIEEISSHLQGKNRNQLINNFSSGLIDILVCTDSLARGIDLPNVQCVISYSAPKYLKSYIHRAGRTARAGEEGLAVTLLNKSQVPKFKEMMNQAEKKNIQEFILPEDGLESLGEQYVDALQELKAIVEKEEKLDLERTKTAKGVKKIKKKRKRNNSVASN